MRCPKFNSPQVHFMTLSIPDLRMPASDVNFHFSLIGLFLVTSRCEFIAFSGFCPVGEASEQSSGVS
jgi:hypothetical protein